MVMVPYAVAVALYTMQSPYAVVLILCPLLIGVIYSIKVRNFRLKDITGSKSISIGICWASGIAFLPLTVCSKELIPVCLIFYFFFTRSTSIPFYLTSVTKQVTLYTERKQYQYS